ncbi:neprosin family prolyl endopeptidase [Amorphoplanes digitatis]|uniref:neprosin family prolyl endopeptidase n=1 Tax=Actinoplanes digitatis TaxID=1868 RepID=UPI00361BC741
MNEDGHVSNSSRGLLAAGLVAAVVGSMGVVWTLSASAEETPEVEIPAAATDVVAEDPVLVPPPLLPWGERPRKNKRGKVGASGAELAASGADAAPPAASDLLKSRPELAPKGGIPDPKVLKTGKTAAVPASPAPPTSAKAGPTNYLYNWAGGYQEADNDGSWANMIIPRPKRYELDLHTLAEISVEASPNTNKQRVEVGWTVDEILNGDEDPHLFVYYWVDGKPGCYNYKVDPNPEKNCIAFQEMPGATKAGYTLPVGKSMRFGIEHFGGAWWIAYGSEWIGYYPDSVWKGNYTRSNVVQWFGEVAAPRGKLPCSQMGNGEEPSNGDPSKDLPATGGRISSISFTNGPAVAFTTFLAATDNLTPLYSVVRSTDRAFRYGGPQPPENRDC